MTYQNEFLDEFALPGVGKGVVRSLVVLQLLLDRDFIAHGHIAKKGIQKVTLGVVLKETIIQSRHTHFLKNLSSTGVVIKRRISGTTAGGQKESRLWSRWVGG